MILYLIVSCIWLVLYTSLTCQHPTHDYHLFRGLDIAIMYTPEITLLFHAPPVIIFMLIPVTNHHEHKL